MKVGSRSVIQPNRALMGLSTASCWDLEWLDDSTFATCGNDRLINIVSLSGTEPMGKLRFVFVNTLNVHSSGILCSGHTGELNMIKCNTSRTRLASSSEDATARIWDIENIRSERTSPTPVVLKGHSGSLTCIKWCPTTAPGTHERLATYVFGSMPELWRIDFPQGIF